MCPLMQTLRAPLSPDALITVIGGSGFIGRYVVQRLAAAGYRVRVAVRRPESALFLKPLGKLGQIQLVHGNITSDAQMTMAFEGATAGINLVGILDEKSGQKFDDVQAEGAGRAARAAAAAGIAHYVQLSAIGADAASPVPYARTKAAGEAATRAAIPTATILRPSLVVGPEDQFLNRFASMARSAPALPVIAGGSFFQPVFVQDVAAAVVAALQDPAAAGRTYELGGPDVMTFRSILQMINALTCRHRPLVEISDNIARLLGRIGDMLPLMPMTSDQFAMLKHDNVVAADALGLVDLGVAPTPLAAFAPAMLERYRPSGRFNRAA
jgi:uncharacterized protein YbjT (DUF2867 family)